MSINDSLSQLFIRGVQVRINLNISLPSLFDCIRHLQKTSSMYGKYFPEISKEGLMGFFLKLEKAFSDQTLISSVPLPSMMTFINSWARIILQIWKVFPCNRDFQNRNFHYDSKYHETIGTSYQGYLGDLTPPGGVHLPRGVAKN